MRRKAIERGVFLVLDILRKVVPIEEYSSII
jgi:hypothetical protein